MPTDFKMTEALDRLYEARQIAVDAWSAAVATRETARADFESRSASEDAKPSEDDAAAFNADEEAFVSENDSYKAKIGAFDARIGDIVEMERRREEARKDHKPVIDESKVVEPLTYTRKNSMGSQGVSYYRDLALVEGPGGITFQSASKPEAQERLNRHRAEMDVEMPKRAKSREGLRRNRVAASELRSELQAKSDPFHSGGVYAPTRSESNPFEYRVEPNQAQGQGGYFIPPLWLEDDYIPQLVAHLVAAGLCRQMDLPAGTDSINIPKVSGGTAVGYQQANNSGVVTQDWTDTAVTANVKTIAGDSDVSLQLLEQSPTGLVDEVITMNLMQQYNAFLDQQVLAGDGVNASQLNGGHLLGIYPSTNWPGTNSVTYTASVPAGFQFAQVLGAHASQVAKTRFDATNFKIVMHGRRWFWYSTAPDSNERPLGETMAGGPFNIQAAIDSGLQAEGLVGKLPHVADAPVYVDNNITTADTTGSGTGQDVSVAGLWDDAWLFQGALRTNVYREVLSASLGVRFQVYNYVAFLLRYGQSFAVGTGTGYAAPAAQGASPAWTPASTLF